MVPEGIEFAIFAMLWKDFLFSTGKISPELRRHIKKQGSPIFSCQVEAIYRPWLLDYIISIFGRKVK